MEYEKQFACPCCNAEHQIGIKGVCEICSICGWEDISELREDPEICGGKLGMSLHQTRLLWESGYSLFDDYPNPNPHQMFPCPVCGTPDMMSEEESSYDICRVCGWEDDGLWDWSENINNMTLEEARKRWTAGEMLFPNYPNPKSAKP